MINRNIGFVLSTLLLVSSMFFPSLQNVYADDTITISTDTVYATDQVLTNTKIIIQNNAKLEIAFGTTITLQRSSIEIKPGSELIIDGTLLFTTPFHSKQYLLNTGTLNLRCGLYPAPTSAFSYTNFGIGTVIDSACPGNVDKIIIDGNDVSIQIGENATIPVGRDAIILHTLYVAGLIDNFGSVSNQGLVTLDNGKVVNSGTWTNVCDNFDSRGIVSLNGGVFQGNPAKKTTCALPIALPDNYSVDEDGILLVSTLNGVLKNDSDADSPTLLVTLDTILPKFGIVNLNSDGSFEYVPQTDFFGTDKFSYKVDDGTDGFATALVTINVIPSNDPPVANNDSITVNEDSLATNIKTIVLSNDTDPDGDVLTITSAGLTTIPKGLVSVINGQLTYNSNSQFEYLKSGQTGTDSFEYTVSDGQLTSTAIVTVTITGQNDKPVALPDNYSLNQNSVLSISAPGLLANDSDIDGNTLTALFYLQPQSGSVIINSDGSFTYTPNIGFFGTDTMSYIVSDGIINQYGIGVVTFTVIDVIPPIIIVIPISANIELGSSPPSLLSGVTTNDGSPITVTGSVDTNTIGDYVIYYDSTDINGNAAIQQSRTYHVVDTVAPNVPVITSPDDGTSTSDPSQTITGTSEPNSTIEVFVNGASTGTTTANSAGNWSTQISLSEGTNIVTTTAFDGFNTSSPSEPIHIVLDTVAPIIIVIPISANIELGSSPPSLLSGVTTNDGSPITVTGSVDTNTIGDYVIYYDSTDINGNAAIQQSRTYHVVDTVAPNVPVITSPDDGTSTSDPSQTITGTSEPNSTIEVFVNGASTGTTTANSAGNWSTQISLSEGTNIVTTTAFDGFNTSSPSEPIHIVLDTVAPIIIVIPISANIELGSSPPSLLSGVTTNDGSPITVTGSVDTNTIGDYVIYYDSTDINGNAAIQQSRTYHVVDTVAPNVPVITSPDDGTSTSDPSQTITGTSEPNSTIEVFVNGASTGTTTANSAGNWSTQISLSEGTNIVTTTAFDGFNTSSPSEPIHIVLDTVAPNVPVITSPDDGTSTSDPSQTITGTSEPNSTIEVFVNGASTGTTTANSAGNWSTQISLSEGTNIVTTTAFDGFNTSSPSEPIHITLTVVNSLLQQKLALIEQLENLINSAQDDKTKKELKKTIKELRKGADSKLYSQDGNSFLDKKNAIKALKYDKQGIKHLVNIYHKGHESNSFKSELAEITIELLRIDKQLIINTYIGTHNLREGTLENFISSLRYVDAETNSEFDDDLSEYDDNMIENFGQSWNKIIHDKDAKKLVKEKMSWKEFVDKLKSEGKWDKAEEKAEKKAQKAEEKAEKKTPKK
ncbi:Ig-like domain-containing protein [Nitrosarchaeum koreense]|uniref:VCBS protein n=1 Tax=Nitrosarchaeum koreense MY1 TaxID=1001994 RepID=F9CV04_9ARCH|nr:Ig-like domain-containing protein [Nitrosarchaeum koreense]EGP94708.1 VCBS protein [Nitrosarchaeum koreense MY1]